VRQDFSALRQPLGDAGALALVELLDETGRMARRSLTTGRFERRLAQELRVASRSHQRLGDLRADLRTEFHEGCAPFVPISRPAASDLRWAFVF
jgi:hypothetical protein